MSESPPSHVSLTDGIPEQLSLEEWAERLELALRETDLGLWDWNVATGDVFYNRQWAAMLGYDADELAPGFATWAALVHPDDMAHVELLLRTHVKGNSPDYEAEHRLLTKSGEYKWILTKGRVVTRDAAGNALRAVGTHRDIDREKRAEEQLRESEDRFRTMLEHVPDSIGVATDGTRVVYVNPAYSELIGWSLDEMVGRSPLEFVHPGDRSTLERRIREIMSGSARGTERYRLRHQNGSYVPVEAFSRKMLFQGRPSLITLLRDLRDRLAAEKKIQEYQDRLRSLTSEVALAEERERRRIAADLHDGPVQALGLAKIKLGQLEASLGKAKNQTVQELRKLIENTLRDTRSLLFDLSPPVLYEIGFVPAVEWLAERTSQQANIPIHVRAGDPLGDLDQEKQVVLFQSVRELLINVVKHADASEAEVSLDWEDHRARIVVSDDGHGFDARGLDDRAPESRGYGLFNLRERIDLMGGQVDICSTLGGGTRVMLWV